MKRISSNQLLNSKWTAVNPSNQEKHFLVTKIELEKQGQVNHCQMMAVMTKRRFLIDWQQLNDDSQWLMGWI